MLFPEDGVHKVAADAVVMKELSLMEVDGKSVIINGFAELLNNLEIWSHILEHKNPPLVM